MNLKPIIPRGPEILREAVIVMAGALLASLVVRGLPVELRRWFSWPNTDQ